MRILIADKFPETHRTELIELGHSCDYRPDLKSEDLEREILGVDILVVRSTKVQASVFVNGCDLKMVIRAGAGTNTIDKITARRRGVHVCNVPGKNAFAVAELTFGLILAIDRNIPDNVVDLRAGVWNKKLYSVSKGIYGLKIGIVGTGAIGLAVAQRANAFGMKIFVIDKPNRNSETKKVLYEVGATGVPDIQALAQTCDILSLHVPATTDTIRLIDVELLGLMKEGAVLINTSRGDLINEEALLEVLDSKNLRVGIDVYANEPTSGEEEFYSKLGQHPNVYGTHHIGASTSQAQNAVAAGVTEIVEAYSKGEVLHSVNLDI